MVSFTDEDVIKEFGYQLFPKKLSLEAYRYVFNSPRKMINAYLVTAAQAFLCTFLSVLLMALCAYPLSRRNFIFKKHLTVFLLITMLFGGGLVPSYILNTQYLKLGNTFWIYILPHLASAFHIIVFRTYFQGLPETMLESAKLDGASELRLFWQMILPLSTPVLATISFLVVLDRWNDWFTSLIYIRNQDLYTLQYLLQRILNDMEFIKKMAAETTGYEELQVMLDSIPGEAMRFALAIVAAGPMMVVFPLFQKYFVSGLTIGAMKG